MDLSLTHIDGALLLFCCAAAVLDARSGRIPNWLTCPTLLVALLAHAAQAGPGALGWALASAVLCAAVPLWLFVRGAMGGGDVKLFAAIGVLVGATFGLEIQLAGYTIAAGYALLARAARGELVATLAGAWAILARRGGAPRATAAPPTGATVRLGVPVAVGAAALLAWRSFTGGS